MSEPSFAHYAPEHGDRYLRRAFMSTRAYAIVFLDREGRITGWSPSAERLFGWSAEEIIGESGAIIFTEEDRRAGSPAVEIETATSEGFADDTRWHIKNSGERFWASAAAEAVYDERGELEGFVKIIRDRTDLKRYEERLEQSNRELDAFASHLAHELRSPLSGVGMMLRLVQRRYADAIEAEDLDAIREAERAIDDMSLLTGDLLAYSQLRSGEKVKREHVESRKVLREALAPLQDEIEERGAEVTTGELPTVYASRVLLRHLFRNLIENGITYNESEVPRVRVEAAEEVDTSAWTFRIEDNGLGIAEEGREALFDLFERGDAEASTGLGIGLALSKRVVEGHGGRIWTESAPGRGSTFFFTLPKRPEDA